MARTVCLACFENEPKSDYVICVPCFRRHDDVIFEVDQEAPSAAELKKKLWGQTFKKNQTPRNRARIAYGAWSLSKSGNQAILEQVKTALLASSKQGAKEDEIRAVIEGKHRPGAANAVAELTKIEKLIGPRNLPKYAEPGRIRTRDGHFVRSAGEQTICNYLYQNAIRYAYEPQLDVAGKDLSVDFYLPDQDLYLEHLGMLTDPRYEQYMTWKIQALRSAGFNVIATTKEEIDSLTEYGVYKVLRDHVPGLKPPEH